MRLIENIATDGKKNKCNQPLQCDEAKSCHMLTESMPLTPKRDTDSSICNICDCFRVYLFELGLEAKHVYLPVTAVADERLVRVVIAPAQRTPFGPRDPRQQRLKQKWNTRTQGKNNTRTHASTGRERSESIGVTQDCLAME